MSGELCKPSTGTSGTDTVINVSTSLELTTVSSPVCERSEKTRETEDPAAVVVAEVPVDSLRRILLEDMEDGCGICLDLCDNLRTLPPTRGDGGSIRELALEDDLFRPPSVGPSGRPSSASDLTLLDVCVDVVDILRPSLLPRVISRSSERLPWALNCERADGWVKAEAKASRTGKGVRFRTCTYSICLKRR